MDKETTVEIPKATQGNLTQTRYRVTEGSCLDCAFDIDKGLSQLSGVRAVKVMSATGVIVVDHDERVTDKDVLRKAAEFGLGLEPAQSRVLKRERPWWRKSELIALAVAGLLLVAGLIAERLLVAEVVPTGLYLATLIVGGYYPALSGLRALRTRRLTISTLLVVAALGAVALGVYEEAALLVVVFSLGEVLEEYASDRARGAIRALMELVPPMAQKRAPDGTLEGVPVESLVPEDIVVVRPGEKLPTDGVVTHGTSALDQSPITGESMPVEVGPGSTVFGGTVNGTGALELQVTKAYADTTLARIIRQVEEAQAHQGRAQRFADRFGAVYTPVMFVLAALIAVVPPLLGGELREWVYRALVVLAVSCSCGLVISVPVAVVSAISRAARDGILVKGGAYLEALGTVQVVAFDKTGTLTRGMPTVTDIIPLNGDSPDEILRLAASVEAASEHPLAGAILRAAQERGIKWTEGRELQAKLGIGVEATVNGQRLFVGKANGQLSNDLLSQMERLEDEGKTAVVVADGKRPLGLLAVADEVRQGASEVIVQLQKLGVQKIILLTGDNDRTAAAIARQTGIADWRASLLPQEKTAEVKRLQEAYGPIAMVGDGVNDAPALATADVGIAMGAAGTDVALETADVALMADDLMKLPQAIHLSRRALGNIRQNIALSLAAVAFLVLAALFGWLTLTSGLLLNEGTAVLIIFNGLRLLAPMRHSVNRINS